MNVLFVTHYTELYGANRSLLNLVQGLQNRGMRFFLIAPNEGEVTNEFQKLGGKPIVFNFPKIMNPESREGNNLSNANALFRIVPQILPTIAQLSIDLIYSNSSVIGLGHWLSAYLKVPHVWHIREFGDLDYDVYPDFGKELFQDILGASSAVVSISQAVREHVFPRQSDNSYVVANGVINENQLSIRAKEAVNEKDTIDISMLGLIIPKKGHIEALSAFAKAEDYDPRLRLNIYGSGNPNFENKLKQFALDNNISHKVIFHGRTNDPLKVLAESDICLVCSESEGFGRVTAEAMAMQCPVIARNSGANAELITHGVNGLLYNSEDELSEMIIDLGRDADLHDMLAHNGITAAKENFTIEKYSQNIYNIIMKSMNEFNINKSIEAMVALLKVIERMRDEGLAHQAQSAFDNLINMYSNELSSFFPNYVNYGFDNISKLIQDLQTSPKAEIAPTKQSTNTRMNLIDQFADQILSGTGAFATAPITTVAESRQDYKVSALVSVYSSREHIKGCLEDLTNQTLFKKGELEIIIIDADSPENEIEIIKPYLDAHTQIKYTRTNERISVYQAWNLAAKMASGKYLTNANTDDRHRADALEIMADYLDNHSDIELVYSDIIVTYYPNETFDSYHDCGYMKRPEYAPEIMLSGCHIGPMPMWRKTIHSEIGYFDEQLISAGDYEFWCRIALKHKLHHLAIELGLYYSNPKGIENSNQTLSIREAEMIRYKYANSFPQPNGSYQNNLLRMENECMLIEKAKSDVFPESRNAHKHLDGLHGLEINASAHNPFGLNSKYVGLTDPTKIAEQERVAGYHVKFDIEAFGDELPLPDESEDYVLSAHVVEHFPDLIKVLVEWFRVIKQGGIMYMMVPNRDTVYSDSLKPLTQWNHVFDDYINQMTIAKEPLFENPKHYHVFTIETLKTIIDHLFGDRMELIDSAVKDDKMGSGFTLVYRKVTTNAEALPWTITPWPESAEIKFNNVIQLESSTQADNSDFINIGMVTYNRLDFTTQAISALIKNADYPYILSVVDNGSTDGTREYLKNLHSKGVIKNLVLLDENVGVARASNLAWSMEPNADFYMKLDNDIVIEKTPFMSTMVELLDTFPALFMTGYNFEPISYPIENVEGYNLRIKESGNLGGACVMIPRRTRELIGVWSEDYGLYGEEDADYCYRVRLASGVIAYCEDENIGLHLPGGKAAVIDPLTFEAEDSSETEIHGDYRRWKDEQRKRNVLLGLYHSIIEDYNTKRKPIKQESRFAKEYFSRHNVIADEKAIVTIIIPVFNKLELTKPCIESVYKIGSKYKFDIIVVDNGSTDGTDEYLRNMAKEQSNFKFIRNEKNKGFAKACNAGIAASKAKYSLLLNNDMIALEGWLDALIDSAERDNDISVAGSLLFYPGGEIIQHCGVRVGLWQGHLMPFHEHKMRDIRFVPSALKSGEAKVVTGACMLLRNSDLRLFGALDDNYINSFEDVDLCLRLRQAGKKVYYCAESKLIHYESMTARRHDNDMANLTYFNHKWKGVYEADLVGQDFQRAIWSVWLREEIENNPDDIAKFNDFIKFLYAVGYAEEAEFILRSRGLDPDKVVEKITSTSENRNENINTHKNEPKELAFIIPLHDNLNYTRDCLASIKDTCSDIDYEVVFVDNASTDGTKEYLQDFIKGDSRIKAVFNNENMAYSIANNLGAKKANADYLVFLNNDTKLLKDCIQSILYTFRNDEAIGVQGAKLLYPNDTVQHAGIVWGPVSDKLDLHYHIYLTFPREADCVNVAREHQFVTGALLAIRSELFQTVGGFDERYYFGHEDLDLCMKVRSEGKKVWYNPYAEAYHFESITKKTEGIEKFERFITHPDSHDARNHKLFLEKWERNLVLDADEYYYSDGMLAFVSSASEKQEYIERVENLKNVFDSLRIENDRTLIDRLAKIILGPAINKPNPQISLGYISDSRLTQAEMMLGIRQDNSIEDYLSILDPNYVPMNNEETIAADFAAYSDDSSVIEESEQENILAEADFVAYSESDSNNENADEVYTDANSAVPMEMEAVIEEPIIEKSEEPSEHTLFDFTNIPEVPEIPFDEVTIEKAKPKKILMTMYGWNESGGGTTFPKSFAKGLVRAGFQVAVVYATHEHATVKSPYYVETTNDDGVQLYGIYNRPTVFLDSENPKREIRDEKVCEIFERVIDTFQPDIVHFHNFLGLSFAIVDIAKEKGLPTIFTPYNYHLIDPRLYMYRSDLSIWQTRDFQMESELTLKYPQLGAAYAKRAEVALDLLNSKLDYTFAVSRRVREIFMEFGANPDRIQVVNQVHDTIAPLIGQSKPFDGTPLRFGFIGGVMPHKGVHTIVQAAQLVPEGSAEFYVYGFASESYIELLRSIDRKNRVKIMGEYQSSDLGSIAQNLSAMILPSIWEDCAPFVITESLAMGLPVIGARIGGFPDFIRDDYNGWLYAYNSPTELAGVISGLASNPSKLHSWQANCHIPLTFKDHVDHVAGLYNRIASGEKLSNEEINLYFDAGL